MDADPGDPPEAQIPEVPIPDFPSGRPDVSVGPAALALFGAAVVGQLAVFVIVERLAPGAGCESSKNQFLIAAIFTFCLGVLVAVFGRAMGSTPWIGWSAAMGGVLLAGLAYAGDGVAGILFFGILFFTPGYALGRLTTNESIAGTRVILGAIAILVAEVPILLFFQLLASIACMF